MIDFFKKIYYYIFGDIMKNINFNKEYYIIKEYKKNDIIKNEGDACDSIGFILKGSVIISNILNNYNEFIITKLYENEMFGESLIFSSNNKYPGTIYANSNVTVAFLKKNKFIELLSIDNNLKLYYLEYFSNRFIELQNRIKILSQPSIKEKFLFYLKIQKRKTNLDHVIIKSISDVSSYLNVPRPSLSRAISELISDGLIIKDKKKYYIIKKAR